MGWGSGVLWGLTRTELGQEGGGPDPSQAPLPPMEPCSHTAQESGPREQVVEPTVIPGWPLRQASCPLRSPPLPVPCPAPSAWGCEPRMSRPHSFCLPEGATVLFLNATDLDRSREYGQESIIYSLEGSSQFRINARSGEPWSSAPSAGAPYPARGPSSGPESPEHTSLEHLALSLKYPGEITDLKK